MEYNGGEGPGCGCIAAVLVAGLAVLLLSGLPVLFAILFAVIYLVVLLIVNLIRGRRGKRDERHDEMYEYREPDEGSEADSDRIFVHDYNDHDDDEFEDYGSPDEVYQGYGFGDDGYDDIPITDEDGAPEEPEIPDVSDAIDVDVETVENDEDRQ